MSKALVRDAVAPPPMSELVRAEPDVRRVREDAFAVARAHHGESRHLLTGAVLEQRLRVAAMRIHDPRDALEVPEHVGRVREDLLELLRAERPRPEVAERDASGSLRRLAERA